MSVEPFPVRRCLHYVDMVRCHVAAQPANKRKEYLKQVIGQHRAFLASAGVEQGLIDRECRELERLTSPTGTPSGGIRMAA
jgi:hypothetical protein